MSDQRQRQQQQQHSQQQQQPQQRTKQAVKAATAATAGGSLLVLSGLTLTGTVILLILATPPLVLCSPVLVPAAITICLILTGFVASGGLGVVAVTVFTWMYRFLTGKHPPGAEQLEDARRRLTSTARDAKDRAQEFGQQHITGSQQPS